MERIALFNKKGMTLIEVMLALTILMIVSLAVMQTALLGMRTNMQNYLRDEAVAVVDLRMNELRNVPFDGAELALVSNTPETPISRTFRGNNVSYTPRRTVTSIDANTKQVTVSVSWVFSGNAYNHSVTTIMRRQ